MRVLPFSSSTSFALLSLCASSGKSGLFFSGQNKIFQSGRNVLLLNNFKRKSSCSSQSIDFEACQQLLKVEIKKRERTEKSTFGM